MKALRFIGYGLLFTLVGLATAFTVVVHNEAKIAEIALARIHDRTGFEIRIAGTRMGLGTRLVLVLEHPRVLAGGVEVATLDDIRAVLSYEAIVRHTGLPLARLILDHPRAKVSVHGASATIGGVPRLGARAVETLKWALDALSDTADQLEVVDAALIDQDNAHLVEHLDLRAYRRPWRPLGNRPWLVDFDAALNHAPVSGLRLSGSFSLGSQLSQPAPLATGRLRFWGLDLRNFDLGALKASAGLAGQMKVAFDNAGVLSGRAELTISALLLKGNAVTPTLKLGDYQASTSLKASPDAIELAALTLHQGHSLILVGKADLRHPLDDTRTLTFDVGGAALGLARASSFVRAIGGVSPQLIKLADRLDAGELTITRAALDTTEPIRDWSAATLRDNLLIDGLIHDGGYHFAPASRLPALGHLAAQLDYSSGVLKLTQGSAEIGASHLESFSAETNLRNAPDRVPYRFQLAANLDLTELYPAAGAALSAVSPAVAGQLIKLDGRAPVAIEAAGDLDDWKWQTPRSYRATVELGEIAATVKNAPVQIGLREGELSLTPSLVTVTHVRLLPDGTDGGYVILNGTIEPRPTAAVMHNVTAEVHRVSVEHWLPLFVAPESLTADGPVGGVLTANSDPRGSAMPAVTGKLTLGTGHIQLGFLRSSIATQSATLTFDGKGLALSVPGGKLEGEPLDLNLTVQDLAHPVLRIDATAARLDFQAMRFMRLPWSARTPPQFFAAPAYGHIEAREAKFDKLPLSRVATDFRRDDTAWHIQNFAARVFEGTLNLQIDGRGGSNGWIHMVVKIADMDAGPPFLLSGETRQPPLTGKLFVNCDLWANTDVDFFDTLGGTIALEARDGTLNRFTLLTRILSLIDLKSWLTAHLPDPRVAGLPFKKLSADLKGSGGDFYTDNLRLDGPVMNVSSKGHVRFGDGQINLEVGLLPFNTANWIVHQIPIVGPNLANGSNGLIAAYFRAYGPFRNPTVTPMPITSVAEFVKKVLGLPINIIAPNTIK